MSIAKDRARQRGTRLGKEGDFVWVVGERLLCFLFFFQAEDGIRDVAVTGVQTCALPISPAPAPGLDPGRLRRLQLAGIASGFTAGAWLGAAEAPTKRSEERRVGKECRSRWSPYH